MSDKTTTECSERGENILGESSFKTPTPSSPDTYVTSTLSCPSTDDDVLYGDYSLLSCRDLPELTFGLIKPDGMQYIKQINKRIQIEGFDIVQSRLVQLSPEQASNFYYTHCGQPYFPLLVTTLCEGPVLAYVLRRKGAVSVWKKLCGPTDVETAKKLWPESLRAVYGTPGKNFKNVCHASDTADTAREEIRFFFPRMTLDGNFQSVQAVEDYMAEFVNPILLEGLTQVCKNKPMDPIVWLAKWLLMHNPYKPKMVEEITLTPT